MIEINRFTFSDADWGKVKGVVEKGLDRDADLISHRYYDMELTLRQRLEHIGFSHLARSAVFSAEQRRARARQLEALEHSAPRFEDKIVATLSTKFSLPFSLLGGSKVDRQLLPGIAPDVLDVTHSFFAWLRDNIDRALTARPTNKNA